LPFRPPISLAATPPRFLPVSFFPSRRRLTQKVASRSEETENNDIPHTIISYHLRKHAATSDDLVFNLL